MFTIVSAQWIVVLGVLTIVAGTVTRIAAVAVPMSANTRGIVTEWNSLLLTSGIIITACGIVEGAIA